MSATSRVLETGSNQITQKFSTSHKALDLVKQKSQLDNIISHSDGKVIFCQTGHKNNKRASGNASYGNCVKIDHGNGYTTLYAHLNSVSVKLGSTVKQGQVIGSMGNTGRSFGAHLHFEVRKNNVHVDPTPYLNADLPKAVAVKEPDVKYRAYAGKWYGEVTNYNEKNASGYAGVQAKNMTALSAYTTAGNLLYRVHLLGKGWLPWVDASNIKDSKNGYAGVKGKKIDAVQMKLEGIEGYEVKYRVSPAKNKNWYGWCLGTKDATGDGYAGVFGNPIDCIQIDIVKK